MAYQTRISKGAQKQAWNKQKKARAGYVLEPNNILSEAMICTTRIYKGVFLKASYQSVTTGSLHWKTAVILRSITDWAGSQIPDMLEHYKKLNGISLNNVKASLHSTSAELLSLKLKNMKSRNSFSA